METSTALTPPTVEVNNADHCEILWPLAFMWMSGDTNIISKPPLQGTCTPWRRIQIWLGVRGARLKDDAPWRPHFVTFSTQRICPLHSDVWHRRYDPPRGHVTVSWQAKARCLEWPAGVSLQHSVSYWTVKLQWNLLGASLFKGTVKPCALHRSAVPNVFRCQDELSTLSLNLSFLTWTQNLV